MKTNRILYILPIAIGLVACEPEFDDVDFNGGSADFSSFVTVGNSLTAGYQSGALSADGQINSLPAMIAGQLKQVGGGEFNQPLLTGEQGSNGVGVDLELALTGQVETRLALKGTVDCLGAVSIGPVRKGEPYLAVAFLQGMESVVAQGPYNNQGVPGAKLTDMTNPAYANPYFARMRTPGQTMLTLATDLKATFFSLWIGNNDVLGYATTGGDDGPTGPNGLTSEGIFRTDYDAAVAALTANGAKGVVANIPDITTIPFFTTVPIGTDAVTEANATALNDDSLGYGKYNGGIMQAFQGGFIDTMELVRRTIKFTGGQLNPFVVIDPSLTDLTVVNPKLISMRQARPGELMTLLLPGDSIKCAGWGTAKPIPGNFHLTLAEIAKISAATNSYNTTIKKAATDNKLAHVDANARLKELATTGITIEGISFSSALVSGGAFSLDGVHPATRGYAIIANDFIDAINRKYAANIPKVSVGSYPAFEVEQ